MANFNDAYKRLGNIEGGYANNPSDRGGETYAGISRKNWPHHQIWKIVDDIKKEFQLPSEINRALQKNKLAGDLVKEFYQSIFWNVAQGDFIKDQLVAEEIFMQSVHGWTVPTIRRVQESCNFLIGCVKNAKWEVMKVDGKLGPKSLHIINLIDALELSDVFLYDLRSREAARFRAIIVNDKSQKGFYAGWLRRLFKK